MSEPYDLERFVTAQAPVFEQVRRELAAGAKRSHWMWFVFPQIAGLGSSPMAQKYALKSLGEAKSYLRHPVLGPRLRDCTGLVNEVSGKSANAIFGSPDDMKFRSSLTLFAACGLEPVIFIEALQKYYRGEEDGETRRILARAAE